LLLDDPRLTPWAAFLRRFAAHSKRIRLQTAIADFQRCIKLRLYNLPAKNL
jgi:hypothetical protein